MNRTRLPRLPLALLLVAGGLSAQTQTTLYVEWPQINKYGDSGKHLTGAVQCTENTSPGVAVPYEEDTEWQCRHPTGCAQNWPGQPVYTVWSSWDSIGQENQYASGACY